MQQDEDELKLLRSVAFQNAQAVLLARERAERELVAANEALERKSVELAEANRHLSEARDDLEKRVIDRTVELNAANDDLRTLTAALLHSRDDEQRRLARELHDSIGQLLVAISMNIDIVRSEAHKLSAPAASCVSENAALLEEVGKQIRTISYLLHPPLLDELGLASALRLYAQGFAERSKIKVELEIPPDFGRLPDDTEMAIFRIIQECLTNIHRHSGSSTAVIRINQNAKYLTLEVRDSGKGISKQRLRELMTSGRTGVGLAGMRERIRHLGGNLDIQSEGNGTVVTATVMVGACIS